MADQSKSRIFVLEILIATALVIFLGAVAIDRFFPTPLVPVGEGGAPGIVGFVPVEINNQPLNIDVQAPSSFVLFTDNPEEFLLTSFRLSGNIEGDGRVEILLDNGLGQELLIYSNVKPRQGNAITGMAVSDEENKLPDTVKVNEIPPQQVWLKITRSEDQATENPTSDLTNKRTVDGEFEDRCEDTCYMDMKMKDGLYYQLKVRVDQGTRVHINSLKYTLDV